jgi:hypothetical protein
VYQIIDISRRYQALGEDDELVRFVRRVSEAD